MTDNCDREIEEARKMIAELEEQRFTQEEYRKHMAEVKARLDAAVQDASKGLVTNEFVAQYIDKIFVTLDENDIAKLEIKIFTGKSTEKWLQKLSSRTKGRTGVISKNMCPTRTFSFTRHNRIAKDHLHTVQYLITLTA